MAHIHINLHVPTPSVSTKQNLQDTFHTVAILFEILHKYHLTESCITFKVCYCNIYERMSNRSTQLTLLNVANLVGGRLWGGGEGEGHVVCLPRTQFFLRLALY